MAVQRFPQNVIHSNLEPLQLLSSLASFLHFEHLIDYHHVQAQYT